jgi:hypothetical protein
VRLMAGGGTWWMFAMQHRIARGEVLDVETLHLVDSAEAERQQRLGGTVEKLKGMKL